MEMLFVLHELNNDPIHDLEKKKNIMRLIGCGNMQKISMIVEEMSVEGEDNRDFSIASIYLPTAKFYCKKVKCNYFVDANMENLDAAQGYIVECQTEGEILPVIKRICKNERSLLVLIVNHQITNFEKYVSNNKEMLQTEVVKKENKENKENVNLIKATTKGKVAIIIAGILFLCGSIFIGLSIIRWI